MGVGGGVANASQTIKKKLLSEDRTFNQALKAAQANELAEKESKQLQRNIDTSSARMLAVNAVHRSPTPHQGSQKQTNPKQKNGRKTVFQVWLITCSYCGKPGHLAMLVSRKRKMVGKAPHTKLQPLQHQKWLLKGKRGYRLFLLPFI